MKKLTKIAIIGYGFVGKAVEFGFRKLFPKCEYKAFPVKVDSHVGVQPFGFESTLQGAINRAKNAYFKVFSDKEENEIQVGIGIEAGMIPVPLTNTGYLDYQFCAIVRADGT